MVAHLVGSRRRDEGDEALQELVALHQNVRGAVAPAGLEAEREAPVGLLFEAIARERRPRDIVAEPLEPAPVSRGNGDVGVETHAGVLGNAGRGFGIGVGLLGLDAIAEAPPPLARVGAGGDAGAERCGGQRGQQGLVAGEHVVVAFGARREQARDAARRAPQDARDLVGARRWEGQEARRRTVARGVDTVEGQRMEVEIRIEGGTEALNEGDGTALATRDAPRMPCAPAELGEERAEEGAKHLAREPRVVEAAVAKRIGEREDPLADRHLGEDAFHEVRRRIGHAAATARGTEPPILARKRQQAVAAAGIAVEPKETTGEDTTREIGAQLALDEAGHGMLALAGAREEGLEVLPDDLVQQGLLGAVARVAGAGRPAGKAVAIGRAGLLSFHPRLSVRAPYRFRRRVSPLRMRPRAGFEVVGSRACGRLFFTVGGPPQTFSH